MPNTISVRHTQNVIRWLATVRPTLEPNQILFSLGDLQSGEAAIEEIDKWCQKNQGGAVCDLSLIIQSYVRPKAPYRYKVDGES